MTSDFTSRLAFAHFASNKDFVWVVVLSFFLFGHSIRAGEPVIIQEDKSHSFRSPVISLAVSPDQKRIFAGSGRTVHVFDSSLKSITKIQSEMDFVCDILCDRERLYIAGGDPSEHGMIEAYEKSGEKGYRLVKRKLSHNDVIHSISKTFVGHLLTASADAKINMFASDTLAQAGQFSRHSKRVTVAEPIQGTDLVISGGLDDTLRVWATEDGQKPVRTMTNHQDDILDIKCLVPDADDSSFGLPLVVSASRDRTVRFWQPTIGRLVRFKKLDQVPTVCCWIPKSKRVLVGCDDGLIMEISYESLEMKKVYEMKQRVFSLEIIGDSKLLIGGRNRLVITDLK